MTTKDKEQLIFVEEAATVHILNYPDGFAEDGTASTSVTSKIFDAGEIIDPKLVPQYVRDDIANGRAAGLSLRDASEAELMNQRSREIKGKNLMFSGYIDPDGNVSVK